MLNADEGLERLRQIQTEFSEFCRVYGRASEADTRVKVIDAVLKEVCGWPESEIQRERHVEAGYIDYVLTVASRRLIAVEAKKEGVVFGVPYEATQPWFKLSGTLATDKEVKNAIDQVRRYSDDSGIRYAVATNGYAWIVFRAIREDIPWRDGRARVFPSLDYILQHFTEFWNFLSYPAVLGGSLDSEFGALQPASRNLFRVLDKLYNADLPLQRNRLHFQLEPLIRIIFDNIADQDPIEVLQSCYVHSASLRIVAKDLDCVITDAVPRFLANMGTEELRQTANDSGRFGEVISRALTKDSGELFLLLGGIGSGKTTFLKRYQRTVGRELLEKNTVWFHIDFLKAPLDPMDLEEFVWREVLNQLRERYTTPHLETRRNIKRVFARDIQAIQETALRHLKEGTDEYERALSPYLERWQQNLRNYVPGLLQICKPKRELSVVLFIDNVDQLSPAYQAQIFLLAQRVTRTVGSITIVSLREESYYTASVQKTFTAYSNKKFHIASPLFRVVIGSRIKFAVDLMKRSDNEVQIVLSSGIELAKPDIADFLQIVQASMFESHTNIVRLLEAICFGNIRLALQMFTTFLTSGATDVDKMLHIYRRDGAYYVAFHEFLKSVMLDERKYYKESQSPIMNVFDCGSERNASHFTALRLLEPLLQRRGENTREGRGYVDIAKLNVAFDEVFDNGADFLRTLNRLVARQLVELNTRSTETIEGASHVRVTSAGWFYSRFLTRSFPYLDLILQDTPLDSSQVEQELRGAVIEVDNLSDREEEKIARMEVRFSRVKCFLDYLESQESTERARFGLEKVSTALSVSIVSPIVQAFEEQREWIRKRLRENRERFAEDISVPTLEEELLEVADDDRGQVENGV